MLSLDTERSQCCTGKVFLIERHDDTGIAANRGCKHMSIIDIRQSQSFDQRLITGDTGVRYGLIHQIGGAIQLPCGQIRAVSQ
ncbi:hypothetical protein D9M71_836140 [compost metagenome]